MPYRSIPETVATDTEKNWDLCHIRTMENKAIFSTENLTELQSFMCETMLPVEDCLDWFCDRFNASVTDEVVDFVFDAHDAFFGN